MEHAVAGVAGFGLTASILAVLLVQKKSEVGALLAENERLAKDLAGTADAAESRAKELEAESANAKQKLTSCTKELHAARGNAVEAARRAESAEKELASARRQSQELQGALEQQRNDAAASAKKEAAALEGELARLRKQVAVSAGAQKRARQLEAELAASEARAEKLQRASSELENTSAEELARLTERLKSMESKASAREDAEAVGAAALASKDTQLQELTEKLAKAAAALEEAAASAAADKDALVAKMQAEQDARVAELTAELAALTDAQAEHAATAAAQVVEVKEKAAAAVSAMKGKLSAAQKEASAASKSEQELTEDLLATMKTIDALDARFYAMQDMNASSISTLKDKLRMAEVREKQARAELSSSKIEAERLREAQALEKSAAGDRTEAASLAAEKTLEEKAELEEAAATALAVSEALMAEKEKERAEMEAEYQARLDETAKELEELRKLEGSQSAEGGEEVDRLREEKGRLEQTIENNGHTMEGLNAELEALREAVFDQKDVACKGCAASAKQIAALNTRLEGQKMALETLGKTAQEATTLKDELSSLKRASTSAGKELVRAETALQMERDRVAAASNEVHLLRQQLQVQAHADAPTRPSLFVFDKEHEMYRRTVVHRGIVISGWLYKLSPHRLKGWQKRWFVLEDAYLKYYEQEFSDEGPKKTIYIPDYELSLLEDNKRPNAFQLTRPPDPSAEGKVRPPYLLAAESADAMEEWMRVIAATTPPREEDEVKKEMESAALVLDVRGNLVGASSAAIVAYLTEPQDSTQDDDVVSMFLLTFRHHTTPFDLLDLLIQRFYTSPPEASDDHTANATAELPVIRRNTLNLLRLWVEGYWNVDFADDVQVFAELVAFVEEAIKHPDMASDSLALLALRELVNGRTREDSANARVDTEDNTIATRAAARHTIATEKRKRSVGSARFFKRQSTLGGDKKRGSRKSPEVEGTEVNLIQLLTNNPTKVAEQLTVMDTDLFASISKKDLVMSLWTKGEKGAKYVARVQRWIDHFNDVSWWVASIVCTTRDLDARTAVVKAIILAAQACFQLRNYNGTMALLSGLNTSSVNRLKKTFASLPKKLRELREKLDTFMSPLHNYSAFRENLRNAAHPCIPFFAIFVSDLTFANDGNARYLDNGLINFEKLNLVSRQLEEWDKLQDVFHTISPDPSALEAMQDLKSSVMSESELHRVSLEVEPRGS